MDFQEFKKQLFADLWEVFNENYYVNDSDEADHIDRVKNYITSKIDAIQVVEDDITEDEEEELMDDGINFIYKMRLNDLDTEDVENFGELLWYDLTRWASKDRFWYDREKGGIYDENDEGGLYAK